MRLIWPVIANCLLNLSCGRVTEENLPPPVHPFSTRFVGRIGSCQAVLIAEDQALTLASCGGDTLWFRDSERNNPYPVVSRSENSGLSILTTSRPVMPEYSSLELDYSGWDNRLAEISYNDTITSCRVWKDGRHECSCPDGYHPPLIFGGYVFGIVDRCASADRTGSYIPTYILDARGNESALPRILGTGRDVWVRSIY
jgi:hypothetical protein